LKPYYEKKINDWTASIEDVRVRELAEKGTIVTGGCIASMLLQEKVNDFDLYFKDKETTEAITKYYVSKFKPAKKSGIECSIRVEVKEDRVRIVVQSAGIATENGSDQPYQYFESRSEGEATEYVDELITDPGDIEDKKEEIEHNLEDDPLKPKYRPVFLSTNAITLSNQIQCVLRFYGDPEEIHKNYDYVHCTNYWTSWDGVLVTRPEALEALLARELRYVGSKYPVCSVFRLRKFLKRGFSINAGQILKMCMQISALDLTNIEVLQDQLTGVDCAYFAEVIDKLRKKDNEKIDTAYLIEIVNRMF